MEHILQHLNITPADFEEALQQFPDRLHNLKSDSLHQYIVDTSVLPREPAPLRELRLVTEKHPWNIIASAPEEGQFLMLLLKLINAKNTMELGVYTGYSLLCTALALPEDGKIIALDVDRQVYEQFGLPIIKKAGVDQKIDFREGLILPQLDLMVENEKNNGFLDFVYVDADKNNYLNYHERLLKLVKVGGVIAYGNTLMLGTVASGPDAALPKLLAYFKASVQEVNKALAADSRIEISQVPIGDGITVCRRVH
eukprot:c28643_g3_i2 orf=371-1132(-)